MEFLYQTVAAAVSASDVHEEIQLFSSNSLYTSSFLQCLEIFTKQVRSRTSASEENVLRCVLEICTGEVIIIKFGICLPEKYQSECVMKHCAEYHQT